MSEQDQLKATTKSANSQERTLKKWASNLTDGEGFIFVRTYKGKIGLTVGQITGKDLLVAIDYLLSEAASKYDIEFGELFTRLAMLHYLDDNSQSSE